jgi:ATP-dependent protease HslVU (ClpYQ) peptidase subunit
VTTVCTDGRTIAADSLMTCGETVSGRKTKKLHRMADGSIIGSAGEMTSIYKALAALEAGKSYKGSYRFLRLFPNGAILEYEGCTDPIPGEAPAAIGSGRVVALAALDCGMSPKEAVKIAMKRDVYTGGRVTEMSV